MHRIEFGHHQGSSWVADLTFEYETFAAAKEALLHISQELQDDREYHVSQKTQVKMFSSADHLYHYITAYYPKVSLPSREVV